MPADRAGLELCEEQRVPHASVWPTVWPITLTNCMVAEQLVGTWRATCSSSDARANGRPNMGR
jgi:hypothetical protein